MFRLFQNAKYDVANARQLSRDPSQTVIRGQVYSVEETHDKDTMSLFYNSTYNYIPMAWPQEADDDDNVPSSAEVRAQRAFTSRTQYEVGQQLDVQILPRDAMSGRVVQELSIEYICPIAVCVPFNGFCAFGFGSMGFWLFLLDVLQDGCQNQAVVLLCVAYVLGPVLIALVLL